MKKTLILIFLLFILIGCNNDLPKLDKPENIFIEENTVHFSKVENASHYVLSINGRLTTITDTQYELTQPGIYIIKVKAQAKGYNDSDYTEEVNHFIIGNDPNLRFIYNLNSTKDLTILDLSIPNPNITLSDVNAEYVLHIYDNVIIKSEYLKTLSVGTYNYVLTINDVPFEIEIEIIDSDEPYLMVNSNYYFNPLNHVIVRFDELNSTMLGISGSNLTKGDYRIVDNVITINKQFINDYFEEHPEYSMYILTIQFKHGTKTHLVRVWIRNDLNK